MKIYPIFYVLLLEPALYGTSIQKTIEIDAKQTYDVKRIFDYRRNHGKIKYLVKWENYRYEKNIWEPFNHL